MSTSLACVLLLVLCTMLFATYGDDVLPASFVFGDSLVDAGNNNYIPSLSRANFPPNGIDFRASGGWPTGRFTNGRTVTDIAGELLGLPDYAPPFLAPTTTGTAILHGVNYASGAAGILNATGRLFGDRLGLDIQIDYFSITRQQFDKLLGKDNAKKYLAKKAIFSLTIGSNDFLNNYLLPDIAGAGERIFVAPDDFVKEMITHMRDQLTRLYSLDARKFVVANVGPIGCTPYLKTTNSLEENECASFPNELARKYNGLLRDLLAELNNNLSGATFVVANVYDSLTELIANHQAYGIKETCDACCGRGGKYDGIIPCGPSFALCQNRSEYIFWDPYHPTEATNLFMAKHFVDGDRNYISPMNLRQLLDL